MQLEKHAGSGPRWWLLALSLTSSAGWASAATAHDPHQLGGFVNAVWYEPQPNKGGSPDAFSVWTCEDGSLIRRYDSWTDSFEFELVHPRPSPTSANSLETLHDIFIETYESGTSDANFGITVGTGGQALYWTPGASRWLPTMTSTWGDSELWACAVDAAPQFHQIWIAGENETLTSTTDLGASWTPAQYASGTPVSGSTFTAMDFADWGLPGTNGVVANDAGQVFWTSDGQSWIEGSLHPSPLLQSYGVPSTLVIWDVSYQPGSTQNVLIVGGEQEGNGPGYAFHSTDGGHNWYRVLTDFETTGVSQPDVTVVKPGDPCTGYPGQIGGTGLNDHFLTIYGVHHLSDGTGIMVGYNAQVWRFDPNPFQCVDIRDSTVLEIPPLWGCHGDGESEVWVSGQWGCIRQSTDKGDSFTPKTPDITWRLRDVEFASSSVGWAGGQFSRLAKTTDGGLTWTEQMAFLSGPGTTSQVSSIAAHDEDSVVALTKNYFGRQSAVLYTDNGGDNCGWNVSVLSQSIAGGNDFVLHEVAAGGIDAGTSLPIYWAGGKEDDSLNPGWEGLIRSKDGGASWSLVPGPTLPHRITVRGIDFLNENVVVIVGSVQNEGRAFMSMNATSATPSWANISPSGFVVPPLQAVVVTGAASYAVGDDGVVLEYDGTRFDYAAGVYEATFQLTTNDLFDVGIGFSSGALHCFLAGENGFMLKSAVGSGTWTGMNSGTTTQIEGISNIPVAGGSYIWATGKHARWGDSTISRVIEE